MLEPGRWFRAPRHVLTLFLGVTGSLSLAMGGLAWQLIAQDRALAARRTQERLDNAADAAVAAVRHAVDDLALPLESLAALASGATEARVARLAAAFDDDAVVVLATERGVDAFPPGRLVFYPAAALQRERAATTGRAFAPGEELEFQRRDLAGALRAFEPLAASANPQLRAGALLRMARIHAQLRRPDRALHAYDALAALGSTTSDELPAGVLARYGRCVLLDDLGRRADLDREAGLLARELDRGTWRLTRAEYEFYAERAREWLRGTTPSVSGAAAHRERLSAAVEGAWMAWSATADGVAPPAGTRLVRVDGVEAFATWRSAGGRIAALVGGPRFIEARAAHAVLARYRAGVVLAAPDRRAGGDARANRDRLVQRAAAETRLPWSLEVVDTAPGTELMAARARSRIVIAGLVVVGLFVLAGSALIVRAVNREMEVSRLQADFVAAVSHDFRTPLTSIRQVSELLLDGRVPEDRRQEYYRMQHRDSARLQRLVESLLDFRRMESGAREYRFEPVEITQLVAAVVDEFSVDAVASGYHVETALESNGVVVSADREALGRAIWNLLDNAAKYSPHYKTVWLTTAAREGRVEIAVRDRGVGVPAQDRERIFDKFARGTNAAAIGARGTGLGLAMVRHTVSAHRGSIRLDGAPGGGSTFTITLPVTGRSSRCPAS